MSPLVWLITGCSGGFGEGFAREVLRRGDKVIAASRDPSRLESLKEAGAAPLGLDVNAPAPELEKVVQGALKIYGRVDVLLNNAGYIHAGGIEETSPEEHLAMFQTTVFGALNMSRAVLPSMRAQKSEKIIFISSIGAWYGGASFGTYCAAKAALSIYAESLRDEVAEFGIKVGCLEPGYFRSDFLTPSHLKGPAHPIKDYEGTRTRTMQNFLVQTNQNQPGDVQRGIKVMVDIITESGVAQGRALPDRIVLGSDAYDQSKGVCDNHLKKLKDWHSVIIQTDRDDVRGK